MDEDIMKDMDNATSIMNNIRPRGMTNLTSHINEIREAIVQMTPNMKAQGKRIVIVLATDGLPTDEFGSHAESVRENFIESLRMLSCLPVWVVVRLCTGKRK